MVSLLALSSELLGISEKGRVLSPSSVFRAVVVLVCPAALMSSWCAVVRFIPIQLELIDKCLSRIWWRAGKAEAVAIAR